MLTSNDVKQVLRRVSGIMRSAKNAVDIGTVTFDGSGLNDMTINLTDCTILYPTTYRVMISETGTPDSIRYTTNGGTTWSTETAITGSAQTLSNGIAVTFGATTGHTLGEYWEFTTSPSYGTERLRDFVSSVNDIEILYDLVSVVYSAGKSPDVAISKYKTECKGIVSALTKALGVTALNDYLVSQSLLVNHDIIDNSLAAVNANLVIPPKTVLGEWVFTAPDTGTWTALNTIDTSKYSGGKIELFALSAITDAGSDGLSAISGVDGDDATVNASATVAWGGNIDQYDGANGQKFQIRTKEDWSPIL